MGKKGKTVTFHMVHQPITDSTQLIQGPARFGPVTVRHLAVYNAERARGIMHDPDWVNMMLAAQEAFDRKMVTDITRRYGS